MKKLSFIIFISSILLFSCFNDDLNLSERETKPELRSTLVSNHPTVTNGIYTFTDLDHYLQYRQDLEQLKNSDYRSFAEEVSEDLDNHQTREPNVTTVFQKLSNDEFDNPQDRYQPFLNDPVIQSFANLDFEYRIGDQLITHINNEQFFVSDANDANITQSIRGFPKGDKFDAADVPPGVVVGYKIDDIIIQTRSCDCEVSIVRSDCMEVRIFGFCTAATQTTTSLGSSLSYKVSLTGFGNSDVDLRTIIVEDNFDITIDISGYPNFNNSTQQPVFLNFQVDAAAQCGATDQAQLAFKPLDGICDDNERDTGWGWKEDGGSQAISYRTKVYHGFFASYQEAEIFSYHKNGNIWNNNKSKISSKISAKRRNAVCEDQNNTETEPQACDHCKSLNASVNTGDTWFCDGDVTGTFKKHLTWQGNSWRIEAEEDVDFECCQ